MKEFAADFYLIFLDATYVKDQPKQIINWLTAVFYHNPQAIDEIRMVIIEQLENDYVQDIKEKYTWLAWRFNHSLILVMGLDLGDYQYPLIQLR